MSDRFRYVVALVVGLLAIPGLAFATNSALSDDEPEGSTEAFGIVAAATVAADPTSISAEDLVRACGVEGRYLVDLEGEGVIDDIQQAALNALRPICDNAGLPLPAPPIVGGETIVETVTVVRSTSGAAPPATTTSTTLAAASALDDASEALTARERAMTAIDTAKAVGGKVEKINEAIALLTQGDAAYESGEYNGAAELYKKAEHKATEAQHELQEHEDDDDRDDDDGDHHDDDDDDDDGDDD